MYRAGPDGYRSRPEFLGGHQFAALAAVDETPPQLSLARAVCWLDIGRADCVAFFSR